MNAKHKGDRHKGDPFDETRVLEFIQGAIADTPGVMPLARGLSHAGEHAAAWLALGVVGMIADEKRRTQWGVLAGAAFDSDSAYDAVANDSRRALPNRCCSRGSLRRNISGSYSSGCDAPVG